MSSNEARCRWKTAATRGSATRGSRIGYSRHAKSEAELDCERLLAALSSNADTTPAATVARIESWLATLAGDSIGVLPRERLLAAVRLASAGAPFTAPLGEADFPADVSVRAAAELLARRGAVARLAPVAVVPLAALQERSAALLNQLRLSGDPAGTPRLFEQYLLDITPFFFAPPDGGAAPVAVTAASSLAQLGLASQHISSVRAVVSHCLQLPLPLSDLHESRSLAELSARLAARFHGGVSPSSSSVSPAAPSSSGKSTPYLRNNAAQSSSSSSLTPSLYTTRKPKPPTLTTSSGDSSGGGEYQLTQQLQSALDNEQLTAEQRSQLILDYVLDITTLLFPQLERAALSATSEMAQLGFSSADIVRVKGVLSSQFDVTVSTAAVFTMQTLGDLSRIVEDIVVTAARSPSPSPSPPLLKPQKSTPSMYTRAASTASVSSAAATKRPSPSRSASAAQLAGDAAPTLPQLVDKLHSDLAGAEQRADANAFINFHLQQFFAAALPLLFPHLKDEPVRSRMPLGELGLSSAEAAASRCRLETALDVQLPMTLLYQCRTLSELIRLLTQLWRQKHTPGYAADTDFLSVPRSRPPVVDAHSELAARLRQQSDRAAVAALVEEYLCDLLRSMLPASAAVSPHSRLDALAIPSAQIVHLRDLVSKELGCNALIPLSVVTAGGASLSELAGRLAQVLLDDRLKNQT